MSTPAEKTTSKITFSPLILINFSHRDFAIMTHYLKHGYPEMEKHTEIGGFWYGYTNRREYAESTEREDPDAYILELTFRQVDTLLKALEPRIYFHPKQQKDVEELASLLLRSLNAAIAQINLACEHFEKTIENNGTK